MATDGKHIFYNPDWVVEKTVPEIVFVLAHECAHVSYCHHTRKLIGNYEHKLWNEACDYAINGGLVSAGFTMPEDGLIDSKYIGWASERIYADLKRKLAENPEDGTGDPDDSEGEYSISDGEWGEVLDAVDDQGKVLDAAGISEEEVSIAEEVHQAAQIEKKIGKGNSDAQIRDVIDSHKGAVQPWYQIIKDHLHDQVITDQSYASVNRRFVHQGLILPGNLTTPDGELVIGIDTSCSLTLVELAEIGTHTQDIVDEINPTRIHIVYCDSEVRKAVSFDRGEDIELKFYGGGGTAFNPVFNWVEHEQIFPHALIYFTDGYGDVGPDAYHGVNFEVPSYPVIWASNGREPYFEGCEPFGEVVLI
tara:strand:- start:412 stop:1500 length:1089 start_codon:yes stop_codon:yes gene_type:complete